MEHFEWHFILTFYRGTANLIFNFIINSYDPVGYGLDPSQTVDAVPIEENYRILQLISF